MSQAGAGRVAIAIGLLVVAITAAYLAARSAWVPLTYDEASAFDRYVDAPPAALFDFASATNHLLNSFLTRLSYIVFGDRPWALRLPNLIAGCAYLALAAALAWRARHPVIGLAGFIVLVSNPYLLDYLALSRGYGLAIALLTASMYFLVRWCDRPLAAATSRRDIAMSLTAAGAAVAANFAIVPAFIAVLTVMLWRLAWASRRTPDAAPGDGPRPWRWRAVTAWALVAAAFAAAVFARERVLSPGTFLPITMRVAGLFEEELASIRVFRVDSTGRLRELPRRPGGVWNTGPVHDDWQLRIVLPAAVDRNLAALDVTMGAAMFRRDRRSPGPWTAQDVGTDRVLVAADAMRWSGDRTHLQQAALHSAATVAGLAALGAALFILARAVFRARSAEAGHAQVMMRAIVGVAGVTAAPLYVLRRDGQLFFGGTTGVAADTFGSLVAGTAYGLDYDPGLATLALVLLGAAATTLLLVPAVSARARAGGAFRAPAAVLAVLAMIVLQVLVQHRLLGTPYPTARTALYLLPLILLFLVLIADAIATIGRTARAVVTFAMLVLAAGSAWNGARAANVTRTLDWPEDSSTVEMLSEVARSATAGGLTPDVVRVGVDWMFYPVARYYADRQSTSRTRYEVIVLPGDGLPLDFVYALPSSDAAKGVVLRQFPESDAVLVKPGV